jgi:hypothetical protein
MHTVRRSFVIQLFPIFIVLLFSACSQKPAAIKSNKSDSIKVIAVSAPIDTPSNIGTDEGEDGSEFATYYMIEVATGYDFDSLKSISSNAVTILGSKFDMLNRIYKPGKGIIVPDSSDDEIYRGEYYPRRPSDDQNFVSIEMSTAFTDQRSDTLKMIALAGMYPLKSQADSVAALLKDKIPTTKILKRELYLGCMH